MNCDIEFTDQAADKIILNRPRTDADHKEQRRLASEARATVVHYARSLQERHELYQMLGLDREPARDIGPLAGGVPGGRAVANGWSRKPKRRRG